MIKNDILIVSIILFVLIFTYLFSTGKIKLRTKKRKRIQIDRIDNLNRVESQEEILDNYKIKYLYHMTHKNNLDSILNNGLLSHIEMHNQNINNTTIYNPDVVARRANRRDTIYNRLINDYAALYFDPRNPMLSVLRDTQDNIIIIAYDRSLIYQEDSMFSDGNAASRATLFYNNLEDLEMLNWNCIKGIYWNDFNDGKRIKCAEVLVNSPVPINKIRKIFCFDNSTFEFVEQAIQSYNYITAELINRLFP